MCILSLSCVRLLSVCLALVVVVVCLFLYRLLYIITLTNPGSKQLNSLILLILCCFSIFAFSIAVSHSFSDFVSFLFHLHFQ